MANTKVTKILMRNGTRQQWINAGTVASLEIGEIGFESDTYRMKIGTVDNDTVGTAFQDLEYFAAGIVTIQEVDATHENGLMIDADGKLELDIGQLIGRVDNHDSVLSDHKDSIDSLAAGFDVVSDHLDEIEIEHRDSINLLIDSISLNEDSIVANNDSIQFIKDSIETFPDSIQAIHDELDEKVNKAGDTMTGSLAFSPDGIIEAVGGSNIYLRDDLTLVQTDAMFQDDVQFLGDQVETNAGYIAVSENDVLDVKSLRQNRRRVVVSQKTSTDGGGILYKENNDVLTYRQGIKLIPIATELKDSVAAATDIDDIKDIMNRFFDYCINYPNMAAMAAPYDIIDEDRL